MKVYNNIKYSTKNRVKLIYPYDKIYVKGVFMDTLGQKIKNIRIKNNLKQKEMAEIFCVSEKTISSWENDRTTPDLNMIYRISDYFKKSFYCLITDEYYIENKNEIEIKLKVGKDECSRILNIIKNNSIYKGNINQIDTYYTLIDKEFDQEWLRVRNENGKYIFNYKKKIDNSHYEKYDVLIDNVNNLNIILSALGVKSIGTLNKNRMIYIYKNKYEFSFDDVENIGMFIEIELVNKSDDFETNFNDLLNVLGDLKIDLNIIERKKYIDYL